MGSIHWKPDRKSNIALYMQIVHYFKDKIGKGELSSGYILPSQRVLAEIFEVNRSTVVEAMNELKSQGILTTDGRRGTRVEENLWDILAMQPSANWDEYISKGIIHPNLKTIQRINTLEYEENIIRLSTGEPSPELFPHAAVQEVLSKVALQIGSLGYEEPKGNINLRKTLSNYLRKFDIFAKPSEILIVSGALQALQLIAFGITHPGERVLVERPSYLKSLHVFQSAGVKLEPVEMDREGIRLMELVRTQKKKPKLLYTIPTFHNPTGKCMSLERRKEILRLCRQKRLPIIEDHTYGELWLDEKPPLSLKAMDDQEDVLFISSTSKTLAPGFRIGYLVASEKVVKRLGDIKMQTDYGSSSLSQLFMNIWIKEGYHERYLEEFRTILKRRRTFVLKLLEKYFQKITRWEEPGGGFYIWLELVQEIDLERLFNRMLEKNYLINIGNIYDSEDRNHIRISYAYAPLDQLQKGLIVLASEIEELM